MNFSLILRADLHPFDRTQDLGLIFIHFVSELSKLKPCKLKLCKLKLCKLRLCALQTEALQTEESEFSGGVRRRRLGFPLSREAWNQCMLKAFSLGD